jgi:hypothetical protein
MLEIAFGQGTCMVHGHLFFEPPWLLRDFENQYHLHLRHISISLSNQARKCSPKTWIEKCVSETRRLMVVTLDFSQ